MYNVNEWLVFNYDDSVIWKRVAWMKCDGKLLVMLVTQVVAFSF